MLPTRPDVALAEVVVLLRSSVSSDLLSYLHIVEGRFDVFWRLVVCRLVHALKVALRPWLH